MYKNLLRYCTSVCLEIFLAIAVGADFKNTKDKKQNSVIDI